MILKENAAGIRAREDHIQGDQNVYANLMITTQEVTRNSQNVLRQSPVIY